jgi:hypothetical protein
MKYREVIEKLQELSEDQLDLEVTLYVGPVEEYPAALYPMGLYAEEDEYPYFILKRSD